MLPQQQFSSGIEDSKFVADRISNSHLRPWRYKTLTMSLYHQKLTCQSTHALVILTLLTMSFVCVYKLASRYFFALLEIFAFPTVNT